MSRWYDRFLAVYEKPLPEAQRAEIAAKMKARQSQRPDVSVVVAAYNEERHIAACLWSLAEQRTDRELEIVVVNNNSKDATAELARSLGAICVDEPRQSHGYARQAGLQAARGKYHFFIDADTFYPPYYVERLCRQLDRPGVAGVYSLWSFYPDSRHSAFGLWCYETLRDIFLRIQSIKRPELCVRGMVFAFRADYGRKCKIRTNILRGEDGALANDLKSFGRLVFLHDRKARPVTGYGTVNESSLWQSFVSRVRQQAKGIGRLFHKATEYIDTEDNLIKQ